MVVISIIFYYLPPGCGLLFFPEAPGYTYYRQFFINTINQDIILVA